MWKVKCLDSFDRVTYSAIDFIDLKSILVWVGFCADGGPCAELTCWEIINDWRDFAENIWLSYESVIFRKAETKSFDSRL